MPVASRRRCRRGLKLRMLLTHRKLLQSKAIAIENDLRDTFDTGWGFANGAPTGLVMDRWNIRLVPHYWLGALRLALVGS